MKKIIIFLALGLLIPLISQAGCCGCDPVYSYAAKGEVTSAVWVRDQACVATGKILTTLQKGWVVQITDKTDGWYKVIAPNGTIGWSGETFFTITDKALTSSTPSTPSTPQTSSTSSTSLAWLKGYILLQVQQRGEAWYVNPTNFKRYYMKDGPIAYEMMRSFGLGITDADLAKIPTNTDTFTGDTALRSRLSGRILLQVQQHGEAWYIYPKTNKRYYLKDGAAAYEIMRSLGLGITDSDLARLASAELVVVPSGSTPSTSQTPSTPSSVADTFVGALFTSTGSQIPGDGTFQKGSVPSGFNYKIVMQHVLDRINYERTKRGKPAIVSDQRMIDTASVWANEMHNQGQITHTRLPVNMIAREWVWQNFKIGFRETWGWLYENIGGGNYNRTQGINESVMASMDDLFDYYMSEEAANGIHYQTIMHDHLTHVGVGFYFDGDNNSGKLYTVFHYGGLNKNIPVIDKVW
ncbi:MAG: CAP domain-containing protein [Patescibacteria group bacterium]|nr:CAP domain-containing protein [Patescibacteria group bacterium]